MRINLVVLVVVDNIIVQVQVGQLGLQRGHVTHDRKAVV